MNFKITPRDFLLYFITTLAVFYIYLINGPDFWAETHYEYLLLTQGKGLGEINYFGNNGYVALLPILSSFLWNHYFLNLMSYEAFNSFISLLLIFSVFVTSLNQLKEHFPLKTLLLFLFSFSIVLLHPSCFSIINIGFFLYVPFAIELLIALFIYEGESISISNRSKTYLAIGILSKPTFFIFIFPFLIFKSNSKKYFSIATIIAAIQIFLVFAHGYGKSLSTQIHNPILGIFNLLLMSLATLGKSLTLLQTSYEKLPISTFSFILNLTIGIIIILTIGFTNKLNQKSKLFLFVLIAAAIAPYMSLSSSAILNSPNIMPSDLNAYIAFSKFKLQYFLISTPIIASILLFRLEDIFKKNAYFVIALIGFIIGFILWSHKSLDTSVNEKSIEQYSDCSIIPPLAGLVI